jgi:photosystem II stability/assembly factor-like uncharacterized protein
LHAGEKDLQGQRLCGTRTRGKAWVRGDASLECLMGLESSAGKEQLSRVNRRCVPAFVLLATAAMFVAMFVLTAVAGAAPTGDSGATLARPWDSFFSIAFLPSGKCYAVGAEGALLTSSDGGESWQRREIAERGDLSWSDLYSIRFASDGQTGWIGGEGGLVLKTTDGGLNWNPQPSRTTENIFRIVVVDSQTAYAAGTNGLLMGTTDGGAHWQPQIFKGGFIFFDVAFVDAHNGWAVGEFETIIHTFDGGKTWAAQMGGKRADFKLPALFAVRFTDAQHGWVAGQGGTLLRTDNGGATWQPFVAPSMSPMYSVTYVGGAPGSAPTELWGSGEGGALIRIALEGAGAPTVRTPTVFNLADLAFQGRNGVAVGLGGTIVHTADGGAHWQVVTGK